MACIIVTHNGPNDIKPGLHFSRNYSSISVIPFCVSSRGFGTTWRWVNDDELFISRWTNHLNRTLSDICFIFRPKKVAWHCSNTLALHRQIHRSRTRTINTEERLAPLERVDAKPPCSSPEDGGLSGLCVVSHWWAASCCQHPYIHLCSRYSADSSPNTRRARLSPQTWSVKIHPASSQLSHAFH